MKFEQTAAVTTVAESSKFGLCISTAAIACTAVHISFAQHQLEDTGSKVKVCMQDAVVMAQKLHALIHPSSDGARPRSLRSVATADLIHVLRDYEKERKSRTRLITVRSNLMGQALQIPFDPVGLLLQSILPF